MDHFAGLDVSVKETSVCIVDDAGKIVREVKVASEPAALLAVLMNPTYHFKRIGLEAGPLSQWRPARSTTSCSHPTRSRNSST
jgi:transposase